MAFVFKGKDVIQKIAVKFVPAFLPEAKKPFYLKPVHQQELDIYGIAAKAEIYKIKTDPDVIIEGFNAAVELIFYLLANGFRIKTPLGTIRIRFPGEYDGSERKLHDGIFPTVRIQPGMELQDYVKEKVVVVIDGKQENEGFIAEAVDEATGLTDEVVTLGNILTIRGDGLKIDAEDNKKAAAGVFFKPAKGTSIKADVIAVNEPKTLKIVVPASLKAGTAYTIEIVTQSSARTGGHLVKELRNMKSEFTVAVQ